MDFLSHQGLRNLSCAVNLSDLLSVLGISGLSLMGVFGSSESSYLLSLLGFPNLLDLSVP